MAMMDPNPKSFPILSYVISRLPSLGPRFTPPSTGATSVDLDSEQLPPSYPSQNLEIITQMPHLTHPNLLASMTSAVSDVAHTRSILRTLGPRPDHETVDKARARVVEIEASLSKSLQELVRSSRPADVEVRQWRVHLAEKEEQCRAAAEKEKVPYSSILQLEELHDAYEKMLSDAEGRLVRIYESAEKEDTAEGSTLPEDGEETNGDVVEVLQKASANFLERVDLSGRRLKFLPEAFGRIQGLVVLNLSNNHLEGIPDSIAGLQNLKELNASSNLLESLPDSIGLLHNLIILNVSTNKLIALPDSICHCKSLVELDVSFNHLTYLPTNIGFELVDLQKLSISLNKIRTLPTSIGEMRSLRHLDAHFNELRGLPFSIGKLTNLETLNLSSNFSDLTELPDTIGDLLNLKDLDLSNNQIQALPDTFGRLDSLTKLNLEQNPFVIPPMEVVNTGTEAVKEFMAKRWVDLLVEEERKYMLEENEPAEQTGWLTRSTSWLKTKVYNSGVTERLSEYLGATNSPKDHYLNQQL